MTSCDNDIFEINGNLLKTSILALKEASREVRKIYQKNEIIVKYKKDRSPVTTADKRSHEVIVNYLKETNIPVLSEEGDMIDYSVRSKWPLFWMLDPLDGTHSFIKKNNEFIINLALISGFGELKMAVVAVPYTQELYWAVQSQGAYRQSSDNTIVRLNSKQQAFGTNIHSLKLIVSRNTFNTKMHRFMDKMGNPSYERCSSALKVLRLAEGRGTLYPRFRVCMEWDTAPVHLILKEAGGEIYQMDCKTPLTYNKKSLENPFFLAISSSSILLRKELKDLVQSI